MNKHRSFIWFATIIALAIFTIELINQRFWLNDFKVYYSAAQALRLGTDVYGQSFGLSTGFYKYSPFTLLCFVPASYFTFAIASTVHFFLIGFCTILSILVIQKIINQIGICKSPSKENYISILSLICILNHLVRELHLGNVNMLIVLLLSACLYFDFNSKNLLAGFVFAMAILIKPYLLILGLPLLLYKKYSTILSAIVSLLVCILIVTTALGTTLSYQLHLNWLKAMVDHNSYLVSSHTFISILNNIGVHFLQQTQQLYLLAFLILIYLIVYLIWIKPKQNDATLSVNFTITYFLFLAILPNLLITDTEHFLYALPVLLILLNYIVYFKNKILIALFILLAIAYGGNSSDILGDQLSSKFEENGVLGLANLGMMLLLLYTIKNQKKLNSHLIN